jgi:predicted regulator of Ras-like GTPase activity (Roadblock/LC7/MglB family)
MTASLWAFVLSLAGASLFFAAGSAWNRLRGVRHEADALVTLGAELEETRAHMLEQEHEKRELHGSEARLAGQLAVAQTDLHELRSELSQACSRAQGIEHELGDLRKLRERDAELRTQSSQSARAAAAPQAELENQIERFKREQVTLHAQLECAYAHAAQQVAEHVAERESLEARLAQSRRATGDAQIAGLQQELGLTHEFLRARDAQLEQLREENARLHALEPELQRAKRELVELAEQTRLLRAEAYASKRPPRKPSDRPPSISTRGNALQLIVDKETETGGAKSAVIADELGLVVAASGLVHEYGDALAALGAYLADVGTKTRDVLPLHELRQVVVRDVHDMTLTVRPLAADDPGLALVTLAVSANSAGLFEERIH